MTTHRMVMQARLMGSVGAVAMLLSACVTVPPPEPEPYDARGAQAVPDARVVPPPQPPYASPAPRDTRPAGPPIARTAPPPPAYGNAPTYDSAAYLWIDDADAFVETVGDAPPDFTFQAERAPVWAWVGSYGDTMLVGRTTQGNVEYHFSPRARVPYFVRDANYAFAFDDDRIVAAYNRDGRVLRGPIGGQLEGQAWAMHERGRMLLALSDNRRWDGDAARVWIDASPTIFFERRVWQDRWTRDRIEDGRHRTSREDRRRRWQADRADRANSAERFSRWSRERHRDGARVAPPGALQPMPGGGAMVPGAGPNRPDRPNRPRPGGPGAGVAPTRPGTVAPLPATPIITPPAPPARPRGPQRPRPIPNEPGEIERMVPNDQPATMVRDVPDLDPGIEAAQIDEQRAAAERQRQAAQQDAERQRQAAQQDAERQRQAASENAERQRQAASENAERQRAAQQQAAQAEAAMRAAQQAEAQQADAIRAQQQAMQEQQQAAQEQQRQQAAALAAERRAIAAAQAAAAAAAAQAAANAQPVLQDRRGDGDNERPD